MCNSAISSRRSGPQASLRAGLCSFPVLCPLILTLVGCQDTGGGGDTVFAERILAAPTVASIEVLIPTSGEEPLQFTGARARNDTLFFLEFETNDLWTLVLGQDPHQIIQSIRTSEYELPRGIALVFWQGMLGFVDTRGTFWSLEGAFPEAVFPFGEEEVDGALDPLFLRDATILGDSLLIATSLTLAPPSGSVLPRTSVDLVGVGSGEGDAGSTPRKFATLAEGMTSMARFFALTEGSDSLWVIDPVRRTSMSPVTDPTGVWTSRPGLAYRLPTAEDLEILAGFQQQIRQMTRQLGTSLTAGLLPDHQLSMRRGYWQGQTLWAVAQSSPGFVLDGYCHGEYQGTWGEQVSAIHFAPPYLITVQIAQDLEAANILRVYPLSALPELCPT